MYFNMLLTINDLINMNGAGVYVYPLTENIVSGWYIVDSKKSKLIGRRNGLLFKLKLSFYDNGVKFIVSTTPLESIDV